MTCSICTAALGSKNKTGRCRRCSYDLSKRVEGKPCAVCGTTMYGTRSEIIVRVTCGRRCQAIKQRGPQAIDPKDCWIHVRMTSEDRARIRELARRAKKNVNAWCLAKLMEVKAS